MTLRIPSGRLVLGGGGGLQIKASSAAPSFDATLYGTPVSWFDATRITGKVDGNAISQWNDQAGTNHIVQATGANQPLYKTAIQNGKPVVRFDGVNDYLRKAFTLAQSYTVLLVCSYTGAFGANQVALDGAVAGIYGAFYRTSSTTMNMFAGAVAPSVTTTPQAWHTYLMEWNGASSLLRVDGVGTSGNSGANAAGGLTLGADSTNAQAAPVDIGLCAIWTGTLTSGNRSAAEARAKLIWATP